MISERHIIKERGNIIPIKQNCGRALQKLDNSGEYSLKMNFFDPSKSSPPNDFMLKLQTRMLVYNSAVHKDMDNLLDGEPMIDDNRDIE
jgi:hypothetical protein